MTPQSEALNIVLDLIKKDKRFTQAVHPILPLKHLTLSPFRQEKVLSCATARKSFMSEAAGRSR